MEIFPAIDLRNSQVVRLTQGDYNRMDVYSSNPAEIAQQFKQKGATNLHVVDSVSYTHLDVYKRQGNGQPLLLSTGKILTTLMNLGMDSLIQCLYKIICLRSLQRLYDLLFCCILFSPTNIVRNATGE